MVTGLCYIHILNFGSLSWFLRYNKHTWLLGPDLGLQRELKLGSCVYQRILTISKSRSRVQTPVRNLQCLPMPQIRSLRTWMFFAPSKSRQRAKVQNMVVAKTSENIQIKIKITNLIQEPPVSSNAQIRIQMTCLWEIIYDGPVMIWKKSKKSISSTSMWKSIPFQNYGFVNFKLTDKDPGNAILWPNFK